MNPGVSMLQNHRTAVFLDGPIGVGKTTYGRFLAEEFSGEFLDGDDCSKVGLPWYASSLSTSHRIMYSISDALERVPIVFIAYPIRCINWVFFREHLRLQGIETILVGLHANVSSIADECRARKLSEAELKRSKTMIEEGYGSRAFSDVFVQADAGNEDEVTAVAKIALENVLASRK